MELVWILVAQTSSELVQDPVRTARQAARPALRPQFAPVATQEQTTSKSEMSARSSVRDRPTEERATTLASPAMGTAKPAAEGLHPTVRAAKTLQKSFLAPQEAAAVALPTNTRLAIPPVRTATGTVRLVKEDLPRTTA